jgi:hypothetical protein
MLIENRDSKIRPAPLGDSSRRSLLDASDKPEERCLSRPVSANDAPAITLGYREGDVFEQSRRTEFDSDIRQ